MSKDFLLEIGVEELPASAAGMALATIREHMEDWLTALRLDYVKIQSFVTPRRMSVIVSELQEIQTETTDSIRGPAQRVALNDQGEWTQAAIGFARAQRVPLDSLIVEDRGAGLYMYANKRREGKPTFELLVEGLEQFVTGLDFPKTMRWSDYDLRFVRPIRWLLALFGQEIVPFTLAGIQSGRDSRGHRVLCDQRITINEPHTYEQILSDAFVIADVERRKEMIVEQVRRVAQSEGSTLVIEPNLLAEVTHLVEFPTAFIGKFDAEYLALPPEVIITTMREHQRYFPVTKSDGTLLPLFIGVRNGDDTSLSTVVRGNEKVLRARLSDAMFFYHEDRKRPIKSFLEKLDAVVYHEGLGTIGDRCRRIVWMTNAVGKLLGLSNEEQHMLFRSAQLCKFDLMTSMVYEFPELRGVMGREYALQNGECANVAAAIFEHYLPRNAEDSLPKTKIGIALALVDKTEELMGLSAASVSHSGSQDPYGFRRLSSGVISLLLHIEHHVPVRELIRVGIEAHQGLLARSNGDIERDILTSFESRLRTLMREQGVRYDVIETVLAVPFEEIRSVVRRARVLQEWHADHRLHAIREAFSRAGNLAKQGSMGPINPALFSQKEETRLYERIGVTHTLIVHAMDRDDEAEAVRALGEMVDPIHQFLEAVQVIVDDQSIRENRLRLLKHVVALTNSIGDMGRLE